MGRKGAKILKKPFGKLLLPIISFLLPLLTLSVHYWELLEVSLHTIEGESIGKSVHTAKNTLVKVKRREESSSTSRCIFSSKQLHFEGSLKH